MSAARTNAAAEARLNAVIAGAVSVADAPGADVVVPLVADGGLALAAGIALTGKRVVVTLSSASRLVAGLEALHHAARSGFACPLVVRVPVGGEAGSHIDVATLHLLDGVEVWTGSTVDELAENLENALRGDRPVVLFEPRAVLHGQAPSSGDLAPPLSAPDAAVSVIAWGHGVGVAAAAGAGVVAVRRLVPLDPAVGAAVRRSGRAVIAHNGEAAWAQRALAVVLADAFEYLESPPVAVSTDVDAIARAVQASLDF
jgi:pyruvate/2-oxoglutarate/acetoin dehydrogenase E1 component